MTEYISMKEWDRYIIEWGNNSKCITTYIQEGKFKK